MNIICLDIDGCILPSVFINNGFESKEIAIETLEVNLKKIRTFCLNDNIRIFLTSSWYQLFIYKDSKLSLKKEVIAQKDEFINKASDLIFKYLNGLFIGISSGDRVKDIEQLSLDKENKIIVFDDWDLSECNKDNVKTFIVFDYLSNFILIHSQNFLRR